jgi:hypothetical protein
MGEGLKSEKKYRACLELKKKKSNINTIKKISILYIERKMLQPKYISGSEFWLLL